MRLDYWPTYILYLDRGGMVRSSRTITLLPYSPAAGPYHPDRPAGSLAAPRRSGHGTGEREAGGPAPRPAPVAGSAPAPVAGSAPSPWLPRDDFSRLNFEPSPWTSYQPPHGGCSSVTSPDSLTPARR